MMLLRMGRLRSKIVLAEVRVVKALYQHQFKYKYCHIGRSLAYMLHFHHHVEVVYMLEGEGRAIIEGKEYTLIPGDVLTVFPNQIHEYKTGKNEKYFITIFEPELLPAFKEIFYTMIPQCNVVATKNENRLLYDIAINLSSLLKKDNVYSYQIYQGLLNAFFAELLPMISLKKASSEDISVLKALLLYFSENYLNDISLDDAAKALHVSKYYLSHLLNGKLNISFNDYLNSLRIADSVGLLEKGELDMTEIARACGFNTARTFNRAFKSIHGMPPGRYKKMNKKSSE